MILLTALLRCRVFVVPLSIACAVAVAQESTESDLSLAIQQLSSRRYEVRQQASRRLVSEGYSGIVAVESSVDQHDLEISRRCVEILAAIAQQKGMQDAALRSLDRLGDNARFLAASLAKKRSFQLRETRQERAIRLLTAAGVRIQPFTSSSETHYVSGIVRDRDCVHLQHLKSVKQVSLSGLGITDKCFQHLAKVPSLTGVTMVACSVSDVGLAELPKLKSLKNIGLSGNEFSAVGLRHLAAIPDLHSVAVYSSIGRDELQVLSECSVRSLYVGRLTMSDDIAEILVGLQGIASLSLTLKGCSNDNLRWVKQSDTKSISLTIEDSLEFTDDGLLHLQVPAMRSLRLRGTGITNLGLAAISGIESLSTLAIYDSAINDSGLQQLADLRQLRSLSLRGTKVTDDALTTLQESMPNLSYLRNSQGARIGAPVR